MKQMLIVDDHPVFRKGLVNTLQQYTPDQQLVCHEAGSGEEAVQLLAERSYDLAVVDISMPGMGGMALLEYIGTTVPQLPVLMVSMYSEDQFALSTLRAGAAGYLTKREAADELLAAVNTIFSGRKYLSHSLSQLLIEQAISSPESSVPSHHSLSKREMEIMKRLATGQRLKFIAGELNLSIKTVSTYKSRVFTKMGFHTTARLINYATSQNLI